MCQSYVVAAGDTPWGIATKTGTDGLEVIAALEQCIGYVAGQTILQVGQRVCLPPYRPGCRFAVAAGACQAYVVQAGDTLASVADSFALKLAELAAVNGDVGAAMRPGDRLRLPPWDERACGGAAAPPAGQCRVYSVVEGDFLFGIADAFRVELKDLVAVNPGLTPESTLRAGQAVRVPPFTAACGAGVAAKPGGDGSAMCREYRILEGDDVSRIALKFGTTVAEVLAANPGQPAGAVLKPGHRIRVPPYPDSCAAPQLVEAPAADQLAPAAAVPAAPRPAAPAAPVPPPAATTAAPAATPAFASPAPAAALVPVPTAATLLARPPPPAALAAASATAAAAPAPAAAAAAAGVPVTVVLVLRGVAPPDFAAMQPTAAAAVAAAARVAPAAVTLESGASICRLLLLTPSAAAAAAAAKNSPRPPAAPPSPSAVDSASPAAARRLLAVAAVRVRFTVTGEPTAVQRALEAAVADGSLAAALDKMGLEVVELYLECCGGQSVAVVTPSPAAARAPGILGFVDSLPLSVVIAASVGAALAVVAVVAVVVALARRRRRRRAAAARGVEAGAAASRARRASGGVNAYISTSSPAPKKSLG
jgi:LysM repeat protein